MSRCFLLLLIPTGNPKQFNFSVPYISPIPQVIIRKNSPCKYSKRHIYQKRGHYQSFSNGEMNALKSTVLDQVKVRNFFLIDY